MKIANIVGARPNFMKIAPIHRRMQRANGFEPILIHTGQHYDEKMSKTFFIDLEMPQPDVYLGVGSGTHAEQTAAVLVKMEKILIEHKPDLIIVVGDVNSTIAASMAAAKLHIPIAHVEAGLRSFDRTMPEEINRILTDAISDYLFVTEQSGLDNLKAEGVADDKVFFVGNCMIDSLVEHLDKASQLNTLDQYHLSPKSYAVATLHRPSNVDDIAVLGKIFSTFEVIQQDMPIIFPIHPRTRKNILEFELSIGGDSVLGNKNLHLVEPLGYLEFLKLEKNAAVVVTDSGGVQEETTYLGVPCLTVRPNTERPVTITNGTNTLVGLDPDRVIELADKYLNGRPTGSDRPILWDGSTAPRIVKALNKFFSIDYAETEESGNLTEMKQRVDSPAV